MKKREKKTDKHTKTTTNMTTMVNIGKKKTQQILWQPHPTCCQKQHQQLGIKMFIMQLMPHYSRATEPVDPMAHTQTRSKLK